MQMRGGRGSLGRRLCVAALVWVTFGMNAHNDALVTFHYDSYVQL